MLTPRLNIASNKTAHGLTEEIVQNFGEVRLRVYGTSMVPAVLPGDFVSVRRANLQDISAGELVLFQREGRFFLHRVIERKMQQNANSAATFCLITRGDRLLHDDPGVSAEQLLGRVVSIERDNRPVPVPAHRFDHPIARMLRASDRATYFYLRLAAWRRNVLPGRTPCQA